MIARTISFPLLDRGLNKNLLVKAEFQGKLQLKESSLTCKPNNCKWWIKSSLSQICTRILLFFVMCYQLFTFAGFPHCCERNNTKIQGKNEPECTQWKFKCASSNVQLHWAGEKEQRATLLSFITSSHPGHASSKWVEKMLKTNVVFLNWCYSQQFTFVCCG